MKKIIYAGSDKLLETVEKATALLLSMNSRNPHSSFIKCTEILLL